MIPETLEALRVPVDGLQPYRRNPRQGDVGAIVQSLERHGQYRPIVVNARTQEVLAGNHTLAAARQLGWDEIAATFVDVDEDTAARIVLVDNRSNDLASYDDAELVDLLRSLPDLEGTGYDGDALDELLQTLDPVERSSGDTEPMEPPEEPRTKVGDLYLLGEHRLLCGDSSDPLALDRVYADAKVGCVLTDPPYGIDLDTDYTGGGRPNKMRAKLRSKEYRRVEGDGVGAFDAGPLRALFTHAGEQFWFGANYYRRSLSASDRDGSWLVWDKRTDGNEEMWGSKFELIWSAKDHGNQMLRFLWAGFNASNARDGFERAHPTEKPIALLGEILTRWVAGDCIIADPFAGSGTTLIACENLKRRCYAMEIDPSYCDVIVDRWERHTGKTAERTEDASRVEAHA